MTENHDFSSLAQAAAIASIQRLVLSGLGSSSKQTEEFSELSRCMLAVIDADLGEGVSVNEQQVKEISQELEKYVVVAKFD